jgi:diguanylate cyclase (GGDEF)-like protein/PAS domain S-box-containing protein
MQSGIGVRTRLRISIGLLGAIVVASAVSLTYVLETVSSALRTATAADVAIQRVLDLNQLTTEIEFDWEKRPVGQWRDAAQALDNAIAALAKLPHQPEDAALQDRLRHNSADIAALFARWTDQVPAAGQRIEQPAISHLIASSIMIRLRAMESITQRLVDRSNQAVSEQMTELAVLLAASLCAITGAVVALFFVKRRIVSSIDEFSRAMNALGEGREAVPVAVLGHDEFGRLARTFVEMQEKLAKSRASLSESNDKLIREAGDRRAAETRFRAAIDVMESGFALFDTEDRLVACNAGFTDDGTRAKFGNPEGHTFEEIFRAFAEAELTATEAVDDREAWLQKRLALHRNPPARPFEVEWTNGQWMRVTERKTADGSTVGIWTDISDLKRREHQMGEINAKLALAHLELKRGSNMLQAIADALPVSVSLIDRDMTFRFCNQHYRTLGFDPTAMVGRPVPEVLGAGVFEAGRLHSEKALTGEQAIFHWSRPGADGRERMFEQHFIPEFHLDGSVTGFYSIGVDITEHHAREADLSRVAVTDALTGLLNRRGIIDALELEHRRWATEQDGGAVLYLDIDHFKQINDTHGHDIGDELLKAFAGRLRSAVRASDKVGRLGGDEFVIVLTAPDAAEIAQRIAEKLLRIFERPIRVETGTLQIGTSIGIAALPQRAAGSTNALPPADEILKAADTALYEAKQGGRNRFALRSINAIAEKSGQHARAG